MPYYDLCERVTARHYSEKELEKVINFGQDKMQSHIGRNIFKHRKLPFCTFFMARISQKKLNIKKSLKPWAAVVLYGMTQKQT